MDIKVSIKAMGKLFWIPIIVNDILIPCVMFLLSVKCKHDVLIDAGMLLIQMFTPFLAAFWIFIHLMKYIEEKGNENFYLVNRNKLSEIIKLCILYIITNTIFFVWYIRMDKYFMYEWIHIMIMSFVFAMGAYVLSYAIKIISMATVPLFIYMISSVTGLNDLLSRISFYEYRGVSAELLISKYSYFIVAGIIMAAMGSYFNNRFCKYNL